MSSWIAERFVSEEHGEMTLEEAGQSYFDDLVSRNMVQPACRGHGYYEGKPEVYTIHGLVRRILTREKNFATLLDNGKHASESGGELTRIQRLSVRNAEKDVGVPESMDISHTRSLFIFGGALPKLSFGDFIFLRIQDLEGCDDLENRHVVEIAEGHSSKVLEHEGHGHKPTPSPDLPATAPGNAKSSWPVRTRASCERRVSSLFRG